MTARIQPYQLGPFVPGVDNRRPEFKMKGAREDRGDFLRSAVNTDISAEGTVKRRSGYVRRLVGADCHSFWSNGANTFMVDGTALLKVTGLPDNATTAQIRNDLTPGRPMSFVSAPDSIYYSNGQVIGRLTPSPAAVNTPPLRTPPSATAIGGSLPPGTYGLCFTHLDDTGRESGSTAPIYITLENPGGIRVAQLPTVFPAGAVATIVYMTSANDQILMRAVRTVSTPSTIDIAVQPALGARCVTLLMRSMPPGDIVRYHDARLLVATGPTLFFSEPFMGGLHNPMRSYIRFAADITVMEPTSGGLWVCADQTYWLPGDVGSTELETKLPYGAVRGSSGAVPNSTDVYWMSPRGIVVGGADGTAENRQESRVAVAAARFSAGMFREVDGRKQIAQSLFAPEPNRMAAASYMDAEVVRRKVTL